MDNKPINSPDAPQPLGSYSQAFEISGHKRLLFVSGQIPASRDGHVPTDFPSQCRLAWHNLLAQLEAAGMSIENLVKVTTFLADRQYGRFGKTFSATIARHLPWLSRVYSTKHGLSRLKRSPRPNMSVS